MKSDGFRQAMERAMGVDDGNSSNGAEQHYVDYGHVKQRLISFAARRRRLRSAIDHSRDRHIDGDEFFSTIAPHLTGGQVILGSPSNLMEPSAPESACHYNLFIDARDTESETSYSSFPQSPKHRVHQRHVMARVTQLERDELVVFLSKELDKCAIYYHEQWQRLSRKEDHLLEIYELGNGLDEHRSVSQRLANEILELYAFCATNIVAVRQILIRYDAFVRTYDGTPMLSWYMKRMKKRKTYNSFRALLRHQELKAVAGMFYDKAGQHDPHLRDSFLAQANMFEDIFVSSKRKEQLASKGHEVLRDSFVQTLRDYFLLGTVADSLGLEPSYLTMRGSTLTEEVEQIAVWRTTRAPKEDDDEHINSRMTMKQIFALALNLLAGFFYLMNYYIVEPSSTNYASALGAHDAMSGLLIGMMPWAAFISSIGYSMWTNVSFRYPLVVASLFLVTGNVIYACAYSYKTFYMALAGRFITGLGAPKVIVRRYMADTTPLAIRTGVNAAFGMVVAVGSALGPAMAILLDKLNFSFTVPFVGKLYVNGMTGPGWMMALLWGLYLVVVVCTFEEPDRQGLQEQKQIEAEKHAFEQAQSFAAEDDVNTIFSGETLPEEDDDSLGNERVASCCQDIQRRIGMLTLPVRLCLVFLFAKVFVIESLVSCTSALTKNRYSWQVTQVGTLGYINGLLVIPLSVLVGWLSMSHQDRVLMTWLVSVGAFGMFLLIDVSDLIATPTDSFNKGNPLAVNPTRYILGYFLTFCSIQSFEGVIGSTLSKVIPTALASGTLNSGLLATLVDTLGRSCGDFFISLVGVINLRQLMNLLFIPAFSILVLCLLTIRYCWSSLAV